MSIEYQNKPIGWDNAGVTPPQDLIEKGFQPGYKPPAEYFNALLYIIFAAIKEIQEKTAELDGGDEKSAGKKVEGETFVINNTNVTAAEGAEIFNYYGSDKPNIATGKYSTAMGYRSHATGDYAFAMGATSNATGFASVAVGSGANAQGSVSTAIGRGTNASGECSVAAGQYSAADGKYSVAIGLGAQAKQDCSAAFGDHATADGNYSFAMGRESKASGIYSTVFGYLTQANAYNFVIGRANKAPVAGTESSTATGDLFVIGNGLDRTSTTLPSNAFRVTAAGAVMGTQNYTASGADYAEMFEWVDGNHDNEDRRGLFVTLDGEKIRPASADDDYILGVVSATPSVVADAQTDDWGKKWETDIFGERLLDENGAWILNDNFREEDNESYVSRLDRMEWAAVGLVGKLIVVDDGTCEVNGYCSSTNGGIATKSEAGYRVLSRIDENHIKILVK